MSEPQKVYVTDEDIAAVNRLHEYYRRQGKDPGTDETFMQWLNEVMQAKRIKEYKRVKQIIENDPAFTKQEPIYTCPTCGARHEDGGRGKPPVYCDECGADWKP